MWAILGEKAAGGHAGIIGASAGEERVMKVLLELLQGERDWRLHAHEYSTCRLIHAGSNLAPMIAMQCRQGQ